MRRRSSSFKTVAVLMLLPIAGLIVFLGWRFLRQRLDSMQTASEPTSTTEASMMSIPKPARAVPTPHPSLQHTATDVDGQPLAAPSAPRHRVDADRKEGGDIVLILDDVGFDHQPMAQAMRIDPNVNFAVLPNSGNATTVANELDAGGFEVLCHLPMEPINYPRMSPGANAVLTSMSDEQIAETTRENVLSVPHARGVNNHMGSRATTDRRVMSSVLGALPKGMYFIDSRTVGNSIAEKVARELNVKTASRQIFLDDVQSESGVRHQLEALSTAAHTHGVAVGIGHMYPVTLRVLAEEAPSLREHGFHFVRASEVVR